MESIRKRMGGDWKRWNRTTRDGTGRDETGWYGMRWEGRIWKREKRRSSSQTGQSGIEFIFEPSSLYSILTQSLDITILTRNPSTEAGIRRNTICYNTWNEIYMIEIQPSWNLYSNLCQTSTTNVRCHYSQFTEKNEVSILINGWVTANDSISWTSFCPPSWNL